jgi:DNA-directed RNA polymerase subunit RPC12/RpoP
MTKKESYFGIENEDNYFSVYVCDKCGYRNISLKKQDAMNCYQCKKVFVIERELE